MYYKNECLRKTDERIKTLVAKGDIKGLASLAAELQADTLDKMYFIDGMVGTLIEMFPMVDVSRVLEHTFNKHEYDNPYKHPNMVRNIPTKIRDRWIELHKFTKEWCVENENDFR